MKPKTKLISTNIKISGNNFEYESVCHTTQEIVDCIREASEDINIAYEINTKYRRIRWTTESSKQSVIIVETFV